jgi:hypothetical protein
MAKCMRCWTLSILFYSPCTVSTLLLGLYDVPCCKLLEGLCKESHSISWPFEALELICGLKSCWSGIVLLDVFPGLETWGGLLWCLQILKFRASIL